MDTVGIVGAGVMGRTVAKKLIEENKQVIAFDAYAASAEKVHDLGATIVEKASDIAEHTDIFFMFLPGPTEVQQCVNGDTGLLKSSKKGSTIIDFSTVDPETSNDMAKLAKSKDVGYLDAPVLGRPSTIGHWALPIGGDKGVLDRCEKLLMLFAAHVIHIGESGSGNKVKLLNQMMFGAINAMTAEMMAISAQAGVPPKLLYETIMASQAATVSNLFKELGRRIAVEDYDNPTFTVDLLAKDVRLGLQMAKGNRTPPILGKTVELINEISVAKGFGDADTAIMWKAYENIWNRTE